MISGSLGKSRSSSRASRAASRHADMRSAAARRIAFVEQQVDHGGDGGGPLRPLHRPRGLVRRFRRRDLAFRPADALFHGALAHQESACDLLDREAGYDAQRERDLLRRRRVGMTADEQQAEHVVAIVGAVEALDDIGLGILQVGDESIGRQRLALAPPADIVERDIAPDQDEPGGTIARRTVDGPVLQGAQAGFLKRFLGPIEVAEIA
jgi:hypothetical protein